VERVSGHRLTAVPLLCTDMMCLRDSLSKDLVELLPGEVAVLTVVVDIAVVLFCRAACTQASE
jgi:hypothetical protein